MKTIVGDLQLQRSNIDKVLDLFAHVESLGLDTIWLGDMLDKRGLVEAECLNILYNYFSKSRLNHKILVGNHDMLGVHSEGHALESLKALKNVWIIDQPTFLSGANTKILMVPYYRDPTKFIEAISFPGVETVFCHQGVKEFTLGSGYTEDEAVNLEDLKNFKLVVCGHYHTPKEMENVVYLGSPFSHSFGESNEQKRIAKFDEETGKLEYINTDFPKHMTYVMNLPDINGIPYSPINYNRMILRGTREQIDAFDKSRYPGFKFIEESITGLYKSAIKETQTPQDMFDQWFKDVKKEKNEDLYKLGLNILEMVK